MFFKLEELYIQAVVAEVPYMMAQLLDQALDKIKKTGILRTASRHGTLAIPTTNINKT